MPDLAPTKRSTTWTLIVASLAVFMVTLDNLVVTTALPTIKADLGASMEALEWTVNAYTLSFAVFLLTGAALGDRWGRRRVFAAGLTTFTLASLAAALAPSTEALVAARALQGLGAAVVAPLSLTLLAEAFPADRRGLALGVWAGVNGLGVAIGPLVGGAVVEGLSWQWIFGINVPLGLVLVPLALNRLSESFGPDKTLDLPGAGLASAGLFALVHGLVRGQALGWTDELIVGSLATGVALLVAFVLHERRTAEPMLPMGFFRSRAFAATNAAGLGMFFGMFGSIFLLSQFLQFAQGNSALQAGLKMLTWTGAVMVVAPFAGALSARFGGRPFIATGLTLQAGALAWMAILAAPTTAYAAFVPAFVMAGAGMALVFAPASATILGAVAPRFAGKASGASNAIRELGGVLGVSVLASVFAHTGSYASPQAFADGLVPALWIGVAVLGIGALIALAIPAQAPQEAPASLDVAPATV
ncbi:MAG TPA: DHA2 family efflux MFS transporter permease subunit [Solirubrobacteraceae bacterium]